MTVFTPLSFFSNMSFAGLAYMYAVIEIFHIYVSIFCTFEVVGRGS